ncbi:MAG: SUMF1/EgtB/PvdO family nonheme iron enzyme [Akkermansia sp.]|nr:SUMF1/EgtB/PvdO family nonheme iron enzyme [Akkermansia sp.]
MNQIFPVLPHTLGAYTLTHQIGAHEHSEIYAAQQEHVERKVLLEVLHPQVDQSTINQFLKTARARVAATLPAVAHVFETMISDGAWYLTQEKPSGTNLETLYRQGAQLAPLQICAILQAIAKLYIACDKAQLQAAALRRADIFMAKGSSGHAVVHFLSPVYDDAEHPTSPTKQMQGLADELEPLLPTNTAGQTRIATLMQWVKDGYEGQYMDWHAVAATAAMIEEQLTPEKALNLASPAEKPTAASLQRAKLKRTRRTKRQLKLLLHALFILLIFGIMGALMAPSEPIILKPELGDFLICAPAGSSDRSYVAKAPVSIFQYEKFLAHYAAMNTAEKARVNRGLPDGYTDHTPAEWQAQLDAARQQSTWQGRPLTEHAPVTGVSYWSAMAYANYRRASLPSLSQLSQVCGKNAASGIQEWTSDTQAANVVLTKSYMVLAEDATQSLREPSPTARLTNRGFRIILPTPPQP